MKSRKPSIPYIIWMVVFTMIPIIMIGFTAFTDKNGNFSFQAFTNAFYYTNIFVKSLWIALISTAIQNLAYQEVRQNVPYRLLSKIL